jgi:ethanolamine utilization protein EutP (predicted NTPase)
LVCGVVCGGIGVVCGVLAWASQAGIVAVGVCPPATDIAATTKLLTDCGAEQVVSIGLHELFTLL